MKRLVCYALLWLASSGISAAVVFERPPNSSGGLVLSSWVDPNGSDADMYAYDEFILNNDASVTEVRCRRGYAYAAMYGHVFDFSVTFFASIAGGSQPLCGNPQLEDVSPVYLAKYWVAGNAGETPAGTFGGILMYDYAFTLPTPFMATAGTKYWLRIEASQPTYPDWAIALGTGGDVQYFRFSTGAAMFQVVPGETAFTLLSLAATGGAGAAPDGTFVPGTPLMIQKGAGSSLALSWGASCLLTDTDYEIYEGDLGSFPGHTPLVCSTAGATAATVTPGSGSKYYIVVPCNGSFEGFHGRSSVGVERPAGPAPCRPRAFGACA